MLQNIPFSFDMAAGGTKMQTEYITLTRNRLEDWYFHSCKGDFSRLLSGGRAAMLPKPARTWACKHNT